MMISGFGERLYQERTKRHMTQKDVANFVQVSASVISNYETGERMPSLDKLISLANLFHCSTDYLLGLEKTSPDYIVDLSMLSSEQQTNLKIFLDSFR